MKLSKDERGIIAKVIDATSRYYGRKTETDVISMMIDDLEDLPAHKIIDAYTEYRRDSRNRTFPLPAQIRGMLSTAISPETLAKEAASRTVEAIKKFGWPHPEKAEAYIGPLGWRAIQAFGGWTNFCREHGVTIQPGQFFAQARDIAMGKLEWDRKGYTDEAPSYELLEESKNKQIRALLEHINPKDFPT